MGGDPVWAKMKGFSAWPGKVELPPEHLKRPVTKKIMHCVFFFGSYEYGWLQETRLRPLCWRHCLCWLLRFLFSNKSLLLIFSLKESMPKDQIVLCLEKSQLFDNSFLCVDYGGDIVIVGHSNMFKTK